MKGASSGGLLLLLIAALGLIGFLTGNLDRWLGYLFDPTRPQLAPAAGATATPTATPALVSVAQTTTRQTA